MIGPEPQSAMWLASSGLPPSERSDLRWSPISAALLARPILVIEDEAVIAWMLETLLEDFGFTDITVVSSGESAIAEASHTPPALIVSDINLGSASLDGVGAVCAIVQRSGAFVVFVSGYTDDDARKRIAAGVPGAVILRKPLETLQLHDAIRRFDSVNPAS